MADEAYPATMSNNPFQPPAPEQVQAHLAAHEPRPASPWVVWGPLLGIGVAIVLAFVIGGPAALLVPWLGLGLVFGYLVWRVRRLRGLERQINETQELAMRRDHRPALVQAWRLIPRVSTQPSMYVRCVALLAHALDQFKAYEAALAAYDALIEKLPEEDPGSVHLRLHRSIAALMAEHLADADDALRRLAGQVLAGGESRDAGGGEGGDGDGEGGGEGGGGGGALATYRLAELIQRVRTHHFDDAAAASDNALQELRPLGVSAGFGHALLALSWRRARDLGDAAQRAQHSATWWQRATLLVPAATLVDRFPELAELAGDTPGPEVAT